MKRKRDYILIFLVMIISFNFSLNLGMTINNTEKISINSEELFYDFEISLAEWTPSLLTLGSTLSIYGEDAYYGTACAKMTGRTKYTQYLTGGEKFILTENTKISFAWKFANKDGAYIGIHLVSEGPDIWFISNFYSYYDYNNESYYIVREYNAEFARKWNYHFVDISKIYLEYYGYIPEEITAIQIYNSGFGPSDGNQTSNQISYFDYIRLYNGERYDPPPPPVKPLVKIMAAIFPVLLLIILGITFYLFYATNKIIL